MNERPIYDALEELRAYREDLQRATYSTFDGVLARYAALFKPDSILGAVLERTLPSVDYEGWWQAVRATMGGMVGSGSLTWPVERPARVALQRQLLMHMASGEPDVNTVAYYFFHAGGRYDDQIREFSAQVVEPYHRDLTAVLNPALQDERASANQVVKPAARFSRPGFIAESRIETFRLLHGRCGFDLRKLVQLCEELNLAYGNGAWFAVALLTRAVLDHIPPAFGQNTFAQVAASEPGRSFKRAAESLETVARKVADMHLHAALREHDSLPNEIQVFSAPALDLVLGEVEARLTKRASIVAASSDSEINSE